ncbi:uncharacterized protein LOC130666200 [Microplitis mediator]|uniref:uncharacterized protein LOC130666200 n=1 Tax=Microplitis mediator TaxID=375433 RepID=UPI0025529D08|nr:uncharacterized protein LOC130666200 [Microplitis mediator]
MWIAKIILLLLIFNTCGGNLLSQRILSQHRTSDVQNQVVELMKLCFSDKLNPVIITQNLNDIINQKSWDPLSSNAIMINDDFDPKIIQAFYPAYPTYVLSTESPEKLRKILNKLKDLPVWNIISSFFIIESDAAENNCQDSSKMLQVLWEDDLINSFYVCQKNSEVFLYTYNPYTNRAPEPWRRVRNADNSDKYWTLFRQSLSIDEGICSSLQFDKTKSLDGYPVKAVAYPNRNPSLSQQKNKTQPLESIKDNVSNISYLFFDSLFEAINATPIINFDEAGDLVNNTAVGCLQALINGTHDIALNLRKIDEDFYEDIDAIKLYYQQGFILSTRNYPMRLKNTSLGDLIYISNEVIVALVLVLSATFIITVFSIDSVGYRNYVRGFRDILKLILGFGIEAPLERASARLIFLIVTLAMYSIIPELQSQISTILCISFEKSYIENFNDTRQIKNALKVIYYPKVLSKDMENYISSLNKSKKYNKSWFREMTDSNKYCDYYLRADSYHVCVDTVENQVEALNRGYNNMRVVQKTVYDKYYSYWTRRNWALKNRIDDVALRLRESGIINYWDKRVLYDKLNKRKTIVKPWRLEYNQLNSKSFVLLYWLAYYLLMGSLIVFILEIIVYKCQHEYRRMLRRWESTQLIRKPPEVDIEIQEIE